jgi:AraC family transcriptional regulator
MIQSSPAVNTQRAGFEHGVSVDSQMFDLISNADQYIDRDPALARLCLQKLAKSLRTQMKVVAGTDAAPEPSVRVRPAESVLVGGLAAWQLKRVREHVSAHLTETITNDELAQIARLSTGHFCRAFRISLGEAPRAFIIRQRIRLAQELMLGTNQSLSEIACACGLADQAHLSRLFRRVTGATPSRWRRTWLKRERDPPASPLADLALVANV